MPASLRPVVVLALLLGMTTGPTRADDLDLFRPGFDNGPELLAPPRDGGSTDAEFTARLESDDPQPGGTATIRVTVNLPRGSYLPSMAESNPFPTRIKVAETTGLEPRGEWAADHSPKSDLVKNAASGEFETIEKFVDHVTFSREFAIARDATGEVFAELLVTCQYCSDKFCKPVFDKPFAVALELAGAPVSFEHTETPTTADGPHPVTAMVSLTPNVAVGEEVELAVRMQVAAPWHVFATTMKRGPGGGPTTIDLANVKGLEAVDETFTPDREAHEEQLDLGDDLVVDLEYFEREVTWTRRYRVTEAEYGIAGEVTFNTCKDGTCLLPETVGFAIGHVPAMRNVSNEKPRTPDAGAGPEIAKGEPRAAAGGEDPRAGGLVPFLLAAVAAGFLALLTPCVFPMVPITVSFFLKQSEKEHTKPLALASVYALGIIGTFTILGLAMAAIFGATGLNQLATNSWLNLAIAGVLIFFALNLLGMFEIRMPSWLVNWSSGRQGQGGYLGALFMALTFTLMSFTCTFAFAGGLLVWAANGDYFWPILGMLAFSAAFALPFFLLALFPSWLNSLPKSGGWMNTVKVTMGLVEFGAAFKFLNGFMPLVFDYSLVMCAWLVISICTGLYLLGVFRLPHDMPSESISVPRFVAAGFFLGLGAFLANGLFAPEEPKGAVWEQIAAFAPPRVEGGQADELGPYRIEHGLQYALDVDKAVEFAKAQGKPLLFDFTGYQCANCRLLERLTHRPENRRYLDEFVLVQLYQDYLPPELAIADEDAERIVARNRELATDWLGSVTLPTYVVVQPNGEVISGVPPLEGYEPDPSRVTTFLGNGVEAWERISKGRTGTQLASSAD